MIAASPTLTVFQPLAPASAKSSSKWLDLQAGNPPPSGSAPLLPWPSSDASAVGPPLLLLLLLLPPVSSASNDPQATAAARYARGMARA